MNRTNYLLESINLLNRNDFDSSKLPEFNILSEEDKQIKKNVENIFMERKFLSEIRGILSKEFKLDDILDKLLSIIGESTNTNRIGIAYIDYDRNLIIAEHGSFDYGRVLLNEGFSVELEKTSLKEIIHSKKAKLSNNLLEEFKEKPNSLHLKLIVEEGIKSNLILPLIINDRVFGILFFSSIKLNNYNEKDLDLGVRIAQEISGLLNTTHLIKRTFTTMTNAFALMVEEKDGITGTHLIRMTEYSRLIAEELVMHENLDYRVKQSFVNDINNHAALHDIGKIGIPDSILKKPGKLTEDEREIMKTHTIIGKEILEKIEEDLKIFNKNFLNIAIDIVGGHHERWDGKGYPHGLKGKEIPLAARIVSIGDVFDSLTSKRPYKDYFGFKKSVQIINEGSGGQFDPVLVKIFNKLLPEIKDFYQKNKD